MRVPPRTRYFRSKLSIDIVSLSDQGRRGPTGAGKSGVGRGIGGCRCPGPRPGKAVDYRPGGNGVMSAVALAVPLPTSSQL